MAKYLFNKILDKIYEGCASHSEQCVVTCRAVVARRRLCVAAKSNFSLQRIQKIDYLGFLEVTQGVERVPRGRALHIMPLNGVVWRR